MGPMSAGDTQYEWESTVVLTSTCRPVRRGIEMRLVIEDQPGIHEYRPDPTLIAAVVKAHIWWGEICAGRVRTIKEIAVRENSDERYVARILKLAFLAPDITAAILDGRQPPHLTADTLIKMSDLPCSWALQHQRLGYCPAEPHSGCQAKNAEASPMGEQRGGRRAEETSTDENRHQVS